MRLRIILFAAVIIALALGLALTKTDLSTTLASGPGTASGGRYVLSVQPQLIGGALSGGRYQLLRPGLVDPAAGCCCKRFLPCLSMNH